MALTTKERVAPSARRDPLAALRRQTPRLVFLTVAAGMAVFVVIPIVAMLVQTVFTTEDGWLGLSVYRDVFGQPDVRDALWHTLVLVVVSVILAVSLGTGLAWVISSTNVPFVRYLNIVPILPMFLPPLIGAVGWVMLLSPRPGLINIALRAILPGNAEEGPLNIYTLWGIIWVNTLYVTPYVFLIMLNAFRQYDSSLDDAARVSGSPPASTFFRVTLPALRPALLGSGVLAVMVSMGDFSVPLILGGPPHIPVLTTQIYNELNNFPQDVQAAAALSTVAIGLTLVILYLQRRWLRGRGRFVTVVGRGSTHRVTELRPVTRWVLFGLLAGYVVIVVVLPIIAIINTSLRRFWSSDLGFSTLTLHNFQLVWDDPVALPSIKNSLILGFVGATIGILLAVIIAYTVQRSRIRGRGALDYSATITLAIPGTVFGASLLYFFLEGPIVLYGTIALLLIAYICYFLPQGYRTTSAALAQASPELEEAAMVCGSSWLGALRTVTLPLLRPAIAAGWIFLFILMSREVAISALLATSGTQVMSVSIIGIWVNGSFTELAAFSVVVLAVSACLTLAAQVIGNRRRI